MQVETLSTPKQHKAFLNIPKKLYKNETTWVCPLDREISSVFNPQKNTFYNHGVATRFLLKDGKDYIGRIAVFIDHKTSQKQEQPTGGIGFFECINSIDASNLLFNAAEQWLKDKKMEAMDGPINFGETDKYWGLLIDGFTHPAYEIAYNHPYYQNLFESYGFQPYYYQEGFHLNLKKPLPERFERIAQRVLNQERYRFEHFQWSKIRKHVDDFATVYNEAWTSFKENFEPMQPDYIIDTLKKAKMIIEEKFIWIAYDGTKPIAIYLMYPDVNQVLKHMNGRLHLINMMKFLYHKNRKAINRARGVLMGVIPEYQGKGIEAGIILKLQEVFKQKAQYEEIEFSWVGDFNPKMKNIFLSVGSLPAKTYVTYRYLFDRNKPFKRYPIPEQ